MQGKGATGRAAAGLLAAAVLSGLTVLASERSHAARLPALASVQATESSKAGRPFAAGGQFTTTGGASPTPSPTCTSSWTVVNGPNIGIGNQLNAVTGSGNDVWALGFAGSGRPYPVGDLSFVMCRKKAGFNWRRSELWCARPSG